MRFAARSAMAMTGALVFPRRRGHHRGIGHPQPGKTMHAQAVIHGRERTASHGASSGGVIERAAVKPGEIQKLIGGFQRSARRDLPPDTAAKPLAPRSARRCAAPARSHRGPFPHRDSWRKSEAARADRRRRCGCCPGFPALSWQGPRVSPGKRSILFWRSSVAGR